jgi:uncharacterized membrane protein YfcA
MTRDEFLREQFRTLRQEIQASKSRALWILVLGTILMMFASYVAAALPTTFASAAIPFVLLVLILAFAAEQNGIIRAGRYVREQIEPTVDGVTGWEQWLESNRRYREVDRYFFAGFVVSFLAFFAISCTLSLLQLDNLPTASLGLCAATAYALGAIFVILVLIRHWHSCTSTN